VLPGEGGNAERGMLNAECGGVGSRSGEADSRRVRFNAPLAAESGDGGAGENGAMNRTLRKKRKKSEPVTPAAEPPKRAGTAFKAIGGSGLRFGAAKVDVVESPVVEAAKPKRAKSPKPKAKNDPTHVAAARELRDRYLDEVNAGRCEITPGGKYAVRRAIAGAVEVEPMPLRLEQAA